jgi:hypothetical protein
VLRHTRMAPGELPRPAGPPCDSLEEARATVGGRIKEPALSPPLSMRPRAFSPPAGFCWLRYSRGVTPRKP